VSRALGVVLDQMAELEKKVAELEARTREPAPPAEVTPLRKASGDEP